MGSEKKSILHALKEKELDEVSLQNYMTYQFVPEPDSLTKNVKRLEPGHQFTKNWSTDGNYDLLESIFCTSN